jgi:DNA-binding CsgD family transcriptional regulator
VRRGRPRHGDILTPREWDVLALISEGFTNEQIASRLGISENTVKTHVSTIYSKLDLRDRAAAASWYEHKGSERRRVLAPAAVADSQGGVLSWGLKLAAGLVGGLVVVAAGVLIVGLLVMAARNGSSGPPHAPEGRTGDDEIDRIIKMLIESDADGLRSTFPDVVAQGLSPDLEQLAVSADEWIAILAGSARELYSVSTGDPQAAPERDFDIVIRVSAPGSSQTAWRVSVASGQVVDLVIGREDQPPSSYSPSVERQYDRFLVLPPRDDLPVPPPGHELNTRTGNSDVDQIVALLRRNDAAGLLDKVSYEQASCGSEGAPGCPTRVATGTPVNALPVRECHVLSRLRDARFVESWLKHLAENVASLHAVAILPAGYQPAGDHLLIVVTREEPYRWEVSGLIERQGRLIGVITSCGRDNTATLYPPAAFIIAPSGNAVRPVGERQVDELLTALDSGDMASLSRLIDYERVGCVTTQDGIGAPPTCESDENPGTPIEVLVTASCEGHYIRREENYTYIGTPGRPFLVALRR